jgi:NADH pyrophosphatase NudC (nudix superfamily)
MKFCPKCAAPLTPKISGGRERLACSAAGCDYVLWGNPVPVVAAVLEYRDEVILVRNVGWPPEWYGLVTGYLEANETPEEAVLREVKEELGLEGKVISLVGVYSFNRKNEVIIAYHIQGSGEILMGEELADYKLVPPADLKPWPSGTGHALRDWLKRREPTD